MGSTLLRERGSIRPVQFPLSPALPVSMSEPFGQMGGVLVELLGHVHKASGQN